MTGPEPGETKTESCEVIAREDVAAIVLFGKLTRNGWLPRSGTVTRTVEGLRTSGAEAIAEASLYGAGFLAARRIERTALGRLKNLEFGRAGLELAIEEMLRPIGSIAPLRSELISGLTLASGLAGGLDSTAGDESASVERASAEAELRGISLGSS